MAKMATKTKSPEKHFDKDKKYCVYEVFRKKKATVFHNRGRGANESFPTITLDGFFELPRGLYLNREGYGIGRKGVFLLGQIKQHLSAGKSVDLVISNRKGKALKKAANATSITLPFDAVKDLLVRFGRMNEDNNNELRTTADQFLSSLFPTKVKATGNFGEYQAGEVASLLRRKNITKKLNQEDLQALNTFFPKIFEDSLKKKGKGKAERDALIRATKKTTDRIFLDDVIREFEGNLRKKTLKEQEWQKFLKDKVFRFMTSHVTTIEKQNVSLNVSYPDFVMVDVYGFIDIYEIKKHDTPLLAYDASHENYYWKPELVQAIAQIENYIDAAVKNADEFARSVMKKKQVEVRVNRPRGYIIAGTSAQFENTNAEEDFHKLGNSLKNIDFILYDELLEKLKNLRKQL